MTRKKRDSGVHYGRSADLSLGRATLWDDGRVMLRLAQPGCSIELELTDWDRKELAALLALDPDAIRDEQLARRASEAGDHA